jgi:homoserine O-acetyltransferase/O-succinyltransferase
MGLKHLKVVLGTSIGGMQTWLWGEMFPNDMDCLVAIASTPAAISGRNMVWREMVSQTIRDDPAWKTETIPRTRRQGTGSMRSYRIRNHDGVS